MPRALLRRSWLHSLQMINLPSPLIRKPSFSGRTLSHMRPVRDGHLEYNMKGGELPALGLKAAHIAASIR